MTITVDLKRFYILLAEEPGGPYHQYDDNDDVGDEIFKTPAHLGVDITCRYAFRCADYKTCEDGARNAGHPPHDHHGEHL